MANEFIAYDTSTHLPADPAVVTASRKMIGSERAAVFNVLDYGAVGDNNTDDTTAILAARDAAGASAGRPTLLFPAATGYRTTATIALPGSLNVLMDGPLIYAGDAAAPALTISSGIAAGGVRPMQNTYRLRVRRATLSTWTNEADLGIRLTNLYWCDVDLAEVSGFTVGVQAIGDGHGFSYNTIRLGVIQDCRIGLDLTNAAGGWCNENVWTGGSFTNAVATYQSTDRVGVRFNSAGGNYYNNANVFLKPSFEIKGYGIPAEGLCVQALYGSYNVFRDARHESPDSVALRQLNGSTANRMSFAYNVDVPAPTADDAGTFSGGLVEAASTAIADSAKRLIAKVDGIHRSACYTDGSGSIAVPGAAILTSATTPTFVRASTGLTLTSDYLEVPNNRAVGFFMSTRTMKRFSLVTDADNANPGRFLVLAYNAAGAVLTDAGTVRSTKGNPSTFTSFGGAWRTGSDNTQSVHLGVSAATDYVFVGVLGGTANLRLRALAAYALDSNAIPSTWLPWFDDGFVHGTTAPTAGTWELGRRILSDTAGGPEGWVCTAAGSPGTWKPFGSITA